MKATTRMHPLGFSQNEVSIWNAWLVLQKPTRPVVMRVCWNDVPRRVFGEESCSELVLENARTLESRFAMLVGSKVWRRDTEAYWAKCGAT